MSKPIQHAATTITEFDADLAEAMDQRGDSRPFTHLGGAGYVLAPRLLYALGSEHGGWQVADRLGSFHGIALVTIN